MSMCVVLLDLNQLGPVKQTNEWDQLVLPDGHRELVQAMVETHTQDIYATGNRDTKIGMDLVQGKGELTTQTFVVALALMLTSLLREGMYNSSTWRPGGRQDFHGGSVCPSDQDIGRY